MRSHLDPQIEVVIKNYFLPPRGRALTYAQRRAHRRLQWWRTVVSAVRSRTSGYCVQNFTDLESDWCFGLEILLHKGVRSFLDDDRRLLQRLNGTKRSLFAFVSILAPYFYYYIMEMHWPAGVERPVFSYHRPTKVERQEAVRPLGAELQVHGFKLVPRAAAQEVLPGIKTECLAKGETTVFNCLFSDLHHPH